MVVRQHVGHEAGQSAGARSLDECGHEGRARTPALPTVFDQHPDMNRAIPIEGQTGQPDAPVAAPGAIGVLTVGACQGMGGVRGAVGDAVEPTIQGCLGAAPEHGEHVLGVALLEGNDPNLVASDRQAVQGAAALALAIITVVLCTQSDGGVDATHMSFVIPVGHRGVPIW